MTGGEPGFVFCARVADHEKALFRYVPIDGDDETEVIGDTLSCLAHAHARQDQGRVLSKEMHRRAYDAWEAAKQDIFERWLEATDPRNLQPSIPKAMRQAAALVRDHAPSDIPQPTIDRYLDAIEAPYGNRIVREFRDIVRDAEDNSGAKTDAAQCVLDKAEEFGLEPSEPPEPLAPITEDDIHLVCWMAITPKDTSSTV